MEQELISRHPQDVTPIREIFVVDDDQDIHSFFAATLAPAGLPVTQFQDGDSFLKEASARVPICVFLDLVLPGRSGIDILRELRSRDYFTPVFAMSARGEPPLVVEAIKNGAIDYIMKPFEPAVPLQRVQTAVELWSYREPKRSPSDVQLSESYEWFRLTPSEREVLALMRSM